MSFSPCTFERTYYIQIVGKTQYCYVRTSTNGYSTQTRFKTTRTSGPYNMGFFDSWFGYRSAPIYSSESVHPREPTHREYRTHTRPQEYVTREPRGPRRGDRHVRFESPPEYSPEYGRTRPASPTFDRMPEPGRRYETRMPRREGLRTQFDREPAGYSYTPPRPQPQRRGYAPPPPRPNVIVREPQVVKQGLRGITRSAQNALNRGPRPFYF